MSNYEKYMRQVMEMKDSAMNDYLKGSFSSYSDYLDHSLKNTTIKLRYRKQLLRQNH